MDRKEFLKRSVVAGAGLGIGLHSIAKVVDTAERALAQANQHRSIAQIVASSKARPAPTLTVNRSLPFGRNGIVDPFIMLDHFGPKHVKPGQGLGVSPHPHRGFEPITFLFEGHVEHRDSLGNTGRLEGGGVQWMTSGKGIIHAEDMCKNFSGEGGILHGVQLWVNLPRKDKMADPGYQDIPATDIPFVALHHGKSWAKVVAGKAFDVEGPAKTFTPITAIMLSLSPGESVEIDLPTHHNAFFQILSGSMEVAGKTVKGSHLVLFQNDGRSAKLTCSSNAKEASELLFLAGEPINEPVYQYGPFVMNSQEEIQQAYDDYQNGLMGHLE